MTTQARYDAKMQALLVAYRQTPSVGLWDRLMRLNSGLVRRVVCRLQTDDISWQELEQAGLQGLSAALNAYTPNQSIGFSFFAIPYIEAAVRARRVQSWPWSPAPCRGVSPVPAHGPMALRPSS